MNRRLVVLLPLAFWLSFGCSSSTKVDGGGKDAAGGSGGAAGRAAAGVGGADASLEAGDARDTASAEDRATEAPSDSGGADASDAADGADAAKVVVVPACPTVATGEAEGGVTDAGDGRAGDGGDGAVVAPGICPYGQDPLPVVSGPSTQVGVNGVVRFDGGGETTDVTYRWESLNMRCGSPGGTFGNANVSSTTFTCSLPGETIITVHMGRQNTSCDVVVTWHMVCEVGGSPSVTLDVSRTLTIAALHVDVFADGSAVRSLVSIGTPPAVPKTFPPGSTAVTKLLGALGSFDELAGRDLATCPASAPASRTLLSVGQSSAGPLECLTNLTPGQSALVQDSFDLTQAP
jgi:hypothetical protein